MVAVVALMLPLAGFTVGWVLSERTGWLLASQEGPQDTGTADQPMPQSPSLPSEDVDGSDIPELSRYPGSVRIEYLREKQGSVIWTEVEYLTSAELSQVREFYRDAFRSQDWTVNDIGYAQNAWTFFVVKGEREVFVEIKPRGGAVEVDIEQTEPDAEDPENEDRNNDSNDEPQNDDGSQGDDSQNNNDSQNNGSQNAAASAPAAPANPAPVQPTPVYDDDYYDDDFDDDLYDDDLYDD